MEHQLPKYVLTADEALQIIQQSIRDPEGLRGSAVLETSYSTGNRRMELAHLRHRCRPTHPEKREKRRLLLGCPALPQPRNWV